jgi:DNA-binding winged helix-turn-helix (wHTH) protein/tetratricopeptide (TPR) repeat protein
MIYRFNGYALDAERETLVGPDGPITLRDHALLVLKLLVQRAPQVVSRDQILQEVWGHEALSESSIAQVIREIRVALGDSARAPTHIATRYGRGYQFVADVQQLAHPQQASGEATSDRRPTDESPPSTGRDGAGPHGPAPTASTPAGHRRTLGAVAALALLLLGLLWLHDQPSMPVADARGTIMLRAVAASDGESLSSAFVDYLTFVLDNVLGDSVVEVVGEQDSVETASRVVEISLASLESGDRRELELAIGRAAVEDPELRLRFDEAGDLVGRGLDEILATLQTQADQRFRLDAGLVSHSSFAIETLLRGMSAQLAGDVERAAELFEAALAEDPEFEFARYELAIALRRQRDFEQALAILDPMRQRLQSDFWTMRINNALGITLSQLERYDEAADALRRAQAAATHPATRSAVLGNIGLLERNQGLLDQAEATLRESLRLAEQADAPRLRAAAHNSLASTLVRKNRVEEALGELQLARELFYEATDLRGYGSVLSRTARIHTARAERAEAESLLRLALGIREQIGDEDGIVDIQLRLARIHRQHGQFAQARELASSALERASALRDDGLVIDAYRALSELALADENMAQARSYAQEAKRLAELTGREHDRRAARSLLIELDFSAAGEPADLQRSLDELTREAEEAGDRTTAVRARILGARLLHSAGRSEDASRMLDRADRLLPDGDVPLTHELDALRAELALERGQAEPAALAIGRLARTNAPPHPSLMLEARLQAARGDLRAAIETAGFARSTIGDWWRPQDQALLDAWSGELR